MAWQQGLKPSAADIQTERRWLEGFQKVYDRAARLVDRPAPMPTVADGGAKALAWARGDGPPLSETLSGAVRRLLDEAEGTGNPKGAGQNIAAARAALLRLTAETKGE